MAPSLKKLFPAHNTPISKPSRLEELVIAFNQILIGEKKAKEFDDSYELPVDNDDLEYEFEHFSFTWQAVDALVRDQLMMLNLPVSNMVERGSREASA